MWSFIHYLCTSDSTTTTTTTTSTTNNDSNNDDDNGDDNNDNNNNNDFWSFNKSKHNFEEVFECLSPLKYFLLYL